MPTSNTRPYSTAKNLEILYFASLAERANKDKEKICFQGDNLTELYQQLSQHYQFTLPQSKLAVAINHEISTWDTPIHDGDIVAFIPPVAGG